jgi:predicted small metal-binding protein
LVFAAHGPPMAFAVAEIAVPCLHPSATARKDGSGFTGRLAMALRIICMCGYVIQGDDDEELWKNAQGHMGVLHPELVGNVTREDLLAQAEQL